MVFDAHGSTGWRFGSVGARGNCRHVIGPASPPDRDSISEQTCEPACPPEFGLWSRPPDQSQITIPKWSLAACDWPCDVGNMLLARLRAAYCSPPMTCRRRLAPDRCPPTVARPQLPAYSCTPIAAHVLLPACCCPPTPVRLLLAAAYWPLTTGRILMRLAGCRPRLVVAAYYRPTTGCLMLAASDWPLTKGRLLLAASYSPPTAEGSSGTRSYRRPRKDM